MTQALLIQSYDQLEDAVRLHLDASFPDRFYAVTEIPSLTASLRTLHHEGLTFSVGKWQEIQADARLYHVALLTEVHTSCPKTGPILELLLEAGVVHGKDPVEVECDRFGVQTRVHSG